MTTGLRVAFLAQPLLYVGDMLESLVEERSLSTPCRPCRCATYTCQLGTSKTPSRQSAPHAKKQLHLGSDWLSTVLPTPACGSRTGPGYHFRPLLWQLWYGLTTCMASDVNRSSSSSSFNPQSPTTEDGCQRKRPGFAISNRSVAWLSLQIQVSCTIKRRKKCIPKRTLEFSHSKTPCEFRGTESCRLRYSSSLGPNSTSSSDPT